MGPLAQTEPSAPPSTGPSPTSEWDVISAALKFIFSGLVLMAISVIVGGKFLAPYLRITVKTEQLFRITIWRVLTIQSTGDEVILGFSGFIVTLLLIGFPMGNSAYVVFKHNFGLDPGQFNALCILSAFVTVLWTFMLYVGVQFYNLVLRKNPSALTREHEQLIERIAKQDQEEH